MYNVKVVAVNEVIEVEVDAKYCIFDSGNNLICVDKLEELAEPAAMFPASRLIAAVKT